MPPKIKDLVTRLRRVGFVDRGGKGSHRNFVHPALRFPVTISGKSSDDAKPYQIKAVDKAVREALRERQR